ncbi:hypothetical protein J2W20_003272 [Sinomonas atrocyanea]|nr:hypothetical protein [Sinomonas atrocyanea]MDR6622945.1 hypothetical protein [Sinomonas atrocyanea]
MRPATQAPSRPCRVDRRYGVVLTAPILGAGPSPGGDARRAGRFGFHGWRARCLSSSSPIHGARRAGNPRRRTEGPSERGPSAARETPFLPSRASFGSPTEPRARTPISDVGLKGFVEFVAGLAGAGAGSGGHGGRPSELGRACFGEGARKVGADPGCDPLGRLELGLGAGPDGVDAAPVRMP